MLAFALLGTHGLLPSLPRPGIRGLHARPHELVLSGVAILACHEVCKAEGDLLARPAVAWDLVANPPRRLVCIRPESDLGRDRISGSELIHRRQRGDLPSELRGFIARQLRHEAVRGGVICRLEVPTKAQRLHNLPEDERESQGCRWGSTSQKARTCSRRRPRTRPPDRQCCFGCRHPTGDQGTVCRLRGGSDGAESRDPCRESCARCRCRVPQLCRQLRPQHLDQAGFDTRCGWSNTRRHPCRRGGGARKIRQEIREALASRREALHGRGVRSLVGDILWDALGHEL